GSWRSVLVAEDFLSDSVVRYEVDDVAADAASFQLVEVVGDIRGSQAAVACSNRRDPLEEVVEVAPGDGVDQQVVTMRVKVNEARRRDQSSPVDNLAPTAGPDMPHGDDSSASERYVAYVP